MEHQNGESRSKRKEPPTPSPTNDRPIKHLRPEKDSRSLNGSLENTQSDSQPLDPDHDHDPDSAPDASIEVLPAGMQDMAAWQRTIEQVVKNVVSIHFMQTASFDTECASSSEATGFVVDAEQGYILTNRVCILGVSQY